MMGNPPRPAADPLPAKSSQLVLTAGVLGGGGVRHAKHVTDTWNRSSVPVAISVLY